MGGFDTTLRFDGDREVDVAMTTVSVSGSRFLDERWTLIASLGLILDGTLEPNAAPGHGVEPGGLAAFGVEYRAREGGGRVPSLDLSVILGASWTNTTAPGTGVETSYFASDLRLGARAGWNLDGRAYPYLALRVFGGPVQWELEGEDVSGTDIHHYQIAAGAAVPIGGAALFAEWSALGEQALGAGLSTAW